MKTLPESRRRAIGLRIKQARERAGLSQSMLAAELGTSTGAVGQWEIGRSRPVVGRLPALAKALTVTPAWLLGDVAGDQDPHPHPTGAPDEAGAMIELDAALVDEAQDLGIDLPAVLDRHVRQIVREARQQRWLAENRAALADANAHVERLGMWSDGKRLF